MLKLKGTKPDGREFILLGLERRNIERLIEGDPILVKGEQLGVTIDVLIFFGETKEAMIASLEAGGATLPMEGKSVQ